MRRMGIGTGGQRFYILVDTSEIFNQKKTVFHCYKNFMEYLGIIILMQICNDFPPLFV